MWYHKVVPVNSEHVYITDVQSENHYFGCYTGDVADSAKWLDEFHQKNPGRALGVLEYGAEAILTWHSETAVNHDYAEEYPAHYHHEMLKTFENCPSLWAGHVWNMFVLLRMPGTRASAWHTVCSINWKHWQRIT